MNIKFDVTIQRIIHDCSEMKLDYNQSYLIAYPEFIKFFSNKKSLTRHDLIISSHFVYGWMPKILTLNIRYIDESLRLLIEAKNYKSLDEKELKILCKCFNGSLVGTSKLLHFINPNLYAIWDSWVFRYLTKDKLKPHHYRMSDCTLYLKYLDLCRNLIKIPEFQEFKKNSIFNTYGSDITDLRVIEIIMFETQKHK